MKENILFIIFMLPLLMAICNKTTNGSCIINGCDHEEVEMIQSLDHDMDHLNFRTAFRLSRSFLGADGIFEWKGNVYTTLYREEV
jgi:hypothetical protein|tara:strand:- start:390 stop:644 length:255 start_codon:yes stop_codon:yes gene_type:complete